VLVLNPDMAVRGATLSQLLSALRADPSIGAATTTLYFPDGCLQRNGSRFTTFGYLVLNYTFLGKLYRWFLPRAWQALQDWLWYADWDRRTAREIDVLPGSALIARRDVWRAAGYFDLRLKMYFSDDYFSRRVQALGLRTLYLPSDGILHYESSSAKQVSARALTLYLRDLVVYTALVHGRTRRCTSSALTEYRRGSCSGSRRAERLPQARQIFAEERQSAQNLANQCPVRRIQRAQAEQRHAV
jgi:GT2 family glycosyltransferase